MARVVALVADLLFGSNLVGTLRAAGHDVELVGSLAGLASAGEHDVLVVDLASGAFEPAAVLAAGGGGSRRARSLASYAHVDPTAREAALRAGFDRVVPRSRLARDAGALVDELGGTGAAQ
jgi:hypothetical protein